MVLLPPKLPPLVAPVRSRPAGKSVVLVERGFPRLLPVQQNGPGAASRGFARRRLRESMRGIGQDARSPGRGAHRVAGILRCGVRRSAASRLG